MNEERLSAELLKLLGEHDFLRLVERFGGTRLYVSTRDVTTISVNLGTKVSQKLADRYGRSIVRVPIAREWRARRYRAGGLSNGEIARKLLITETGVDKLFARMHDKPVKGSDPSQLRLFG